MFRLQTSTQEWPLASKGNKEGNRVWDKHRRDICIGIHSQNRRLRSSWGMRYTFECVAYSMLAKTISVDGLKSRKTVFLHLPNAGQYPRSVWNAWLQRREEKHYLSVSLRIKHRDLLMPQYLRPNIFSGILSGLLHSSSRISSDFGI